MSELLPITFKEDDHTYWLGDERMKGCNGLLHEFGFHFDQPFWAAYGAFKNNIHGFAKLYRARRWGYSLDTLPTTDELVKRFEPLLEDQGKYLDEEAALIMDAWTKKAEMGTQFHLERELEAHATGIMRNPFQKNKEYPTQEPAFRPEGADNASYLNLQDIPDGGHTELVIFNRDYMICGQADEVFIETIDGKRYVDIGDHKTNSKKPTLRTDMGYCKYPIENIPDCTYMHYTLQLSVYMYMMELEGFIPRNLGIYWYKDFDVSKKTVIPFRYCKDDVAAIFDYHDNFFPGF